MLTVSLHMCSKKLKVRTGLLIELCRLEQKQCRQNDFRAKIMKPQHSQDGAIGERSFSVRIQDGVRADEIINSMK